MKKKQILALIMAGTLAAGMAPATMAFAEADSQAVTAEDTAAEQMEEGTEQVSEEAPVEEGAAAEEPTQAPATEEPTTQEPTAQEPSAQEPAQEPTQAPADTPAAENQNTDNSQNDGFNSGTAEAPEAGASETATPAEGTTGTEEGTEEAASAGKIYFQDSEGNQTECATLADAISMAPANADKNAAPSQILITGTIELSETITIADSRNVSIAAAEDGAVIKRADGFLGDMFLITGENTAFQFGTGKNGDTILSLTVDASSVNDATGSIVSLEKGYFGMSDGVTLTGSRTSAPGSAIYNQGGSIGLGGGTVTENQSLDSVVGGAIYSEGEIRVSGNVIVNDNKDDGIHDNSIVLSGEKAYIAAIGELSETADLQVRRTDADTVKVFVTLGKDAEGNTHTTLENVLAHVHYLDSDKYTVNAKTGELEEVKAPTVSAMKLIADSLAWDAAYDHTVNLVFHTNDEGSGGKYYATWVKKSQDTPSFEEVKKNYIASNDIVTKAEIQFTNVDYDTDIKVVVYGVDSKGMEAAKPLVLTLEGKATPTENPAEPTPTTRPALTPPVTDSKITGLEEALAFYPKTMYNFKVVGAGTDNTSPVKGDTKWIPYGWSMNKNNIRSGYEKSFSIGNQYGIKDAKTFKMYIFFQKYIYNGTDWVAVSGVQEALEQKFYSKAIEFTVTPSVTVTSAPSDDDGTGGGSYDGGSGDGSDTDPENHDGDSSDTGSSSATNARTADSSPIATMMMLASLSLVAGGYVLVRKRKKEN